MGKKWTTVSTSTYADGSPSDDGSATEANRVKFATIRTDLTDPLDTAIDSIVANLDELFDESATSISTDYTTVASDHAHILEVDAAKTITLLAASTAGAGYRVGVCASGATVTVARSGSDTINGATSVTVPDGSIYIFTVNAAGDGYVYPDDTARVEATVATTSGTSNIYSSIPAWARKITFVANGISTNGTDTVQIRLGIGGGLLTTGYQTQAFELAGGGRNGASTGFFLTEGPNDASATWYGVLTLTRVNAASGVWGAFGIMIPVGVTLGNVITGTFTNATPPTQIGVATTTGTDVFDGGSFYVVCER